MSTYHSNVVYETATTASNTLAARTLFLPDCKRLRINAPLTAELRVDPNARAPYPLTLKGNDNVIEHVTAEIHEGTLIIGLAGSFRGALYLHLSGTLGAVSHVTARGAARVLIEGLRAPDLHLCTHGAAKLVAHGEAEQLQVECSGTSRSRVECLRASVLTTRVSGTARLELHGTAERLHVDASGAAKVTAAAPSFWGQQLTVQLKGASRVHVSARSTAQGHVQRGARLQLNCPGTCAVTGRVERV